MIGRLISGAALLGLATCSPAPRSVSYFEAHADDAETVVAACRRGVHRGEECLNAQAALASLRRDARMEAYRKGF